LTFLILSSADTLQNGLEVSFVCTHWLPPLANAANAIPLHAPAHSRQHPNDIHNRVRREKVVDGSDIRTTVMLRNIPNKLDWVCPLLIDCLPSTDSVGSLS
jgi:hypothetical protein